MVLVVQTGIQSAPTAPLLLSSFCPFTPLIYSHFWDEQVNIILLHLVPVSAFCLP